MQGGSTRKTEIFLITSKEEGIYSCCGRLLKYRDNRLRVHKTAGGNKEWYLVRRLKCSSDKCGRSHLEYLCDPFTNLGNGYKKVNVLDFLLNENCLEKV